ncbi:GlxA family transcriptional regulator [Mesorhizobium sp. CO1-1-8]|uniref:GlxA family transcriptional regulator n=1 Tax=Mesorhizobium sp. CO1-1-8 TaxID=2876631 RepID=UPI001CD188A2|nr:GlxA family transcriptional regulator [Mesorhizobium sp. CO1-1-8]MBZ9772541.1 GlxA family transcriptional regulator [Mesorhizobium sp. CO1-1-8]
MARRISFVVVPGFEPLDLSGPMSAFHCALETCNAAYEINVVSSTGGAVPGWFNILADTVGPHGANHGDTVIVVGGPEAHEPQREPDTVNLLGSLAASSRRIAGVCTGTFYLAEAGLLDGHRVTTHWRWAPLLQARYPQLSVNSDRIYLNDGKIWTSAGVTAGIDLALALIESDYGSDVSQSVARELVVYHRRPGGQSQFSAILDLAPESDRVRKAIAYARDHLGETLSVESLAEAAHVSSRQFSRVFLKETGETPARAVERIRAEVARPRIEEGYESIELIAHDVGFGDVERMRRTFLRLFGQTPQALRRIARAYAREAALTHQPKLRKRMPVHVA